MAKSNNVLTVVRRVAALMSRAEKAKFYALLAARCLVNLLDVAGLVYLGFLILGLTGSAEYQPLVMILAAVALAVFVTRSALAIFFGWLLSRTVARIESRVAGELMRNLLDGGLDSVTRRASAEYQFLLTSGGFAAFGGLLNAFSTVVTELVLLTLIIAAFMTVDAAAALAVMVYFALVGYALAVFSGRILERTGQQIASGTVTINNMVGETISTFREIAVMNRRRFFWDRFLGMRRRLAHSAANNFLVSGLPRHLVETALIVGVVIFIGLQLTLGNTDSGLLTVGIFLAGGMRIMAAMLPLQNCLGLVSQHAPPAAMLLELLEEQRAAAGSPRQAAAASQSAPRQAAAPQANQSAPSQPAAIHVESLCFSYADTQVLQGIDLTIPAGNTAAIIGPSGAGKTTLVDIMLGLLAPAAGTVRLGEHAPDRFPGRIAYVPQKPGIISGTVAENVTLGAAADPARVAAALREANFPVDTIPPETLISHDSLSGGQVQRLGVARALYAQPSLLVMDEATSALDAESEHFIGQTLKQLHGKVTVLVVAHRLSTIKSVDTVYVLDAGRVLASGKFDHLVKTVPLVAEYARLMSLGEVID